MRNTASAITRMYASYNLFKYMYLYYMYRICIQISLSLVEEKMNSAWDRSWNLDRKDKV